MLPVSPEPYLHYMAGPPPGVGAAGALFAEEDGAATATFFYEEDGSATGAIVAD
jgi:hypothetical protein